MISSVVCLAHHWLVTHRGGEKVLAEMRALFPAAPIATLVFRPSMVRYLCNSVGVDSPPPIIVSRLRYLPFSARLYKVLLPLHPWAIKKLTAPRGTRLVLSTDASMIKGLCLPEGARQICYCHSPPRYLWDMQAEYSNIGGVLGPLARLVFRATTPQAKRFDYLAAQKVDFFIANSRFVASRIERFYGRAATVVYPPVAVSDFSPNRTVEDFYLLVTQLTPYKRADLAVRALTKMGKKLVVIGEGSEFSALRRMAGPSVQLMGRQPFSVVKDHFERCRAFLYPQIEDFGITAVEAQAAGKPVIAFRAGGALETVIEGETGVFFEEQTPESLSAAILRFEAMPSAWAGPCRRNAERFRPERFRAEIKAFLGEHYPELFKDYAWPI